MNGFSISPSNSEIMDIDSNNNNINNGHIDDYESDERDMFVPLSFIAKEVRDAMKKLAKKTEERNHRESLLYQRLPNETLDHCFSFMGLEELLNAAMSCRLFRKLASNQKHWFNLYYSTWGLPFPLAKVTYCTLLLIIVITDRRSERWWS